MTFDDRTLTEVPEEETYHVRCAGFQKDVGDWSARNFDWPEKIDNAQHDPLVGLVEEAGELAAAQIGLVPEGYLQSPQELILAGAAAFGKMAHAVLKTAQGIRKDENHQVTIVEQMKVLLGILNALGGRAGMEPGALEGLAHHIGLDPLAWNWANPELAGGTAQQRKLQADAVGDIAVYLADYCERNALDLERSVNHTWGRPVDPVTGKGGVRHRNWKKHEDDGGGHAKVEVEKKR